MGQGKITTIEKYELGLSKLSYSAYLLYERDKDI